MNPRDFAVKLGPLLDAHLHKQEKQRRAVSRLAAGNAFEGWLSFETRLLLEESREGLAPLASDHQLADGRHVHRYWLANEHKKVDLFIGDCREDDEDSGLLAVEFKLIFNNKNWPEQVDQVWTDLFPKREAKAKLKLAAGRLAVVGVVRKVYPEGGWYPGQRPDLAVWEQEMFDRLLPKGGRTRQHIERVWQGDPFDVHDDWLAPGFEHSFQIHILAVGT